MNADSYGLKLNEQSSEQTVYDYNMLMSAMNVSVSKHLMDENFTVVWANDYFYSQTLYTKKEYEAIYRNSCRKYFAQYPEEYAKMAKAVNPYGDGHACERIADAIGWYFELQAERPEDFCPA